VTLNDRTQNATQKFMATMDCIDGICGSGLWTNRPDRKTNAGVENTAPILARMKNAEVKNNAVQLMLPV